LDCVANRENISLLYTISNRLKTVKDATIDEKASSEVRFEYWADKQNLYVLSELANVIMRNKADVNSWPLSSYPGKIKLPKDVFHNLHTPAEVNQVCQKRFS
jgi:sister chromatid cohesion protein PDS5